MRLVALLPVALLLLLPGSAEAAHRCPPKGAKVVRARGSVHIYKLHHEVYACLGRAGKRYSLGESENLDPYGASYVSPIRIRGTLVAFARQSWDHYGAADATVVVRDLSDGRTLHSFSQGGGGPYVCEGQSPAYTVTDLALAPSGSVAWIASVGYCDGDRQEVRALTDSSEPALLDEGSGVDAESLRYAGGSIFWVHANRPGSDEERSARLP